MNRTNITSLLLFLCFVIYVAIELNIPFKAEERKYQDEVEKLHKKNDSLQKQNILYDYELVRSQMKIDSLQYQFNKQQEKIQILKTKRDEKVNRIDSLNTNELYLFFTNFKTGSSENR